MPEKTLTREAQTFEPETITRYHRLQRALADRQILEEFLVNPKEVADRYEISLSEPEIQAVRNASHFLAQWEFFCGEGQWLDACSPVGRTAPSTMAGLPEIVARRVREHVAQDIVTDVPDVLRRVVTEVGSATLIDPEETLTDLPEHIQPVARALRKLVRTMSREINRELSDVTLAGIIGRRPAMPGEFTGYWGEAGPESRPIHTGQPPYQGNHVEKLSLALANRLQEVVNRAVGDAVSQIRPAVHRQVAHQAMRPRTEQPHA